MKSFKIRNQEITEILIGKAPTFPKYTTQIINLINRNAQGTRPKVVGKVTDLIQECPYKDFKGWKKWYQQKKPSAIKMATERIYNKLKEMKIAVNHIDKKLIKKWVEDLVLTKTFAGLRLQEVILIKVAELENKKYRLANAKEESKGIDGYIGNKPISIKASTYKIKPELSESINVRIIYYDKKKDGIVVTL